jgi:hypothetical protein
MHGRLAQTSARLRAILLVAALAVLALPAVARAGVAEVRVQSNGDPGKGYQEGQYVTYVGGDEVNVVTARLSWSGNTGTATLTDSAGLMPGKGCVRPDADDPTTVTCTLTEPPLYETFDVKLGGGDDSFTVLPSSGNATRVSANVDGGPGDDVLHDGVGGNLAGGPGNDQLYGGDEGTSFDESDAPNGTDTIVGGASLDTLDYSGRHERVLVDLAHPERHEVYGGGGDDRLIAGADAAILRGGGGTDTIIGGPGNDDLEADGRTRDRLPHTADRLDGGAGNDYIEGSAGANEIDPGPGRDRVFPDAGDDRVFARDGAFDFIECGGGEDRTRLDVADVIGSDCEHADRAGKARARFDPASFAVGGLPGDPPLSGTVMCSNDVGGACHVTVSVRRHGRLLASARHVVRRGNDDAELHFKLTARGRRLLSRAGRQVRVRVRVATHLRHGRTLSASSTELLNTTPSDF